MVLDHTLTPVGTPTQPAAVVADLMACRKCGEPHEPVPRCQGHAKTTGKQCRARAIAGGTVCKKNHGGAAPQVMAAAAVRVIEAKAAAAVRDLTGRPVDDPVLELLRVAGETIALKDLLRGEVERLSSLETYSASQGEEVRALLRAFERALDRCGRFLVDINRLGLEAKRVQLEAATAAALVAVFREVLDLAGLSVEQWAVVDVELPARWRAAVDGA